MGLKLPTDVEQAALRLAETRKTVKLVETTPIPFAPCGRIWTLRLNFWPRSTNVLMRAHHSSRNKMLRADADLIGAICFTQDIPKATGPRSLKVMYLCPDDSQKGGAKAMDGDNGLKSLLDALVKAGRLLDDGPAGLPSFSVFYGSGPRGVVVMLEDV